MFANQKKSSTLAAKISNILNAAPAPFDSDDDNQEIQAKLTEGALENQEDQDEDDVIISKFRKQNINFLDDVDVKYAGKKASRKKLQQENLNVHATDESSDEDNVDYPFIEKGSDDDDNEAVKDSDQLKSSEESDNSGQEIEDSDDLSSCTENEDFEENNIDTTSIDDNFKKFSKTDKNNEIQKGICVRNQLNIWENLLEIRIQLQKCLLAANKFPQRDYYKNINIQSLGKFKGKAVETSHNIKNTLNKLLQLQQVLLKQYPETKKSLEMLEKANKTKIDDDENEEIPSNTENETEDSEEEIPHKRRKLSYYENEMKKLHENYSPYRNSVIQKWNDKTKIVAIKSSGPIHSVLNQIEHILSDKQKLIRRSQIKKSKYEIIGKRSASGDNSNTENNEYNDVEIFDDDDFYHQLLKELIEVKSADVTDPVKLGRQWIQLQSMRSKMKRNIDTRATKGRKVRYTIHTKLVNFMAPIENNLYSDEARTELYNSLFSKQTV